MKSLVAVTLLIALAACHKPAPLDASFFGSSPVPPGGMARARIGMIDPEVAAVLPGFTRTVIHDDVVHYARDTGIEGVQLYVQLEQGKVDDIVVYFDHMDVRPLMEQAWGPGEIGEGIPEFQDRLWKNPSIGLEARLACSSSHCALMFRAWPPPPLPTH